MKRVEQQRESRGSRCQECDRSVPSMDLHPRPGSNLSPYTEVTYSGFVSSVSAISAYENRQIQAQPPVTLLLPYICRQGQQNHTVTTPQQLYLIAIKQLIQRVRNGGGVHPRPPTTTGASTHHLPPPWVRPWVGRTKPWRQPYCLTNSTTLDPICAAHWVGTRWPQPGTTTS